MVWERMVHLGSVCFCFQDPAKALLIAIGKFCWKCFQVLNAYFMIHHRNTKLCTS